METTSPADVLVISTNDKVRTALHAILAGDGWTVHQATSHPEAMALLRRKPIPVIIANGKWREILEYAISLPRPPSVIVTVAFADEALWAEVLNLGGYDVLPQPFDPNEVTRIIQAGFRRSQAAMAAG